MLTTKIWIQLACYLLVVTSLTVSLTWAKSLAFVDPNTKYQYIIKSQNITSNGPDPRLRSVIRVSRVKLDPVTTQPIGAQENVQTLPFHQSLVDFDINCLPTHCYLVTVTNRPKQNIELYAWQRTQFDLKARRDSYAQPHSVRLFKIKSTFYIAVAQDQLHLLARTASLDSEEQNRFIGSAILKFTRGISSEKDLKYHQFIKLGFHPRHVRHFVSTTTNGTSAARLDRNHYLVFSLEPTWQATSPARASTFIWSQTNEYFWPYRLPVGVQAIYPAQVNRPNEFIFPNQYPNQNKTQFNPASQFEPVESCFIQLQHLLSGRESQSHRLIESSRNIWRSPQISSPPGPINISAQVIVSGNVIVRGSLVETPQVALIGSQVPMNLTDQLNTVYSHSPLVVENKLNQAVHKLGNIRNKLSKAIPVNLAGSSIFNSRIMFFGPVHARTVHFRNGLTNSNVRLNGIPFHQLEHELVSLEGEQNIAARVVFRGNVMADLLEIHGTINDEYLLKDALDITSRRVQVIDRVSSSAGPGYPALEFGSVIVPELTLTHNATFNEIRLTDFITRDNRVQTVVGKKSFKSLSIGKLDMAEPETLLNGFDIGRTAMKVVRLRNALNPADKLIHTLTQGSQTFMSHVTADRLFINNLINERINISSLIHDSVKIMDVGTQLISGYKNFLYGLYVDDLTTEGSINKIQINQVFNLNPTPPTSDYMKYRADVSLSRQHPITGQITFMGPVTILGNLNGNLINDVDLMRSAVKRFPIGAPGFNMSQTQVVSGKKVFVNPLMISNRLRLLDQSQMNNLPRGFIFNPPLINGIDLRLINEAIKRQIQQPPVINIGELIIDGNMNLPPIGPNGSLAVTLGGISYCPLNSIRSKSILADADNQLIELPVRVNTLRSRSILLEPGSLNGLTFPEDFVLRSTLGSEISPMGYGPGVEPVFGRKTFSHLSVATNPLLSPPIYQGPNRQQTYYRAGPIPISGGVVFGTGATLNSLSYGQIQDFVNYERNRNSTGEIIVQTLNVHGNIVANKINGYDWPDDILLKSASSIRGSPATPAYHRRIYSPLIFTDSSFLEVENQLVLRGPVQLSGLMNGVNMTEFLHRAATYGDKDLFSTGRPLSNKIFQGGVTVKGEVRSGGLIDGVYFDEMKSRVVTTRQSRDRIVITGPKVFLSDVHFLAPVRTNYLNDLLVDRYLGGIQLKPDSTIILRGKRITTGELFVNRKLSVLGKINRIDFTQLHAISLSPNEDQIQFNRTLTIEGDVYMDNLHIDERDGYIDGVKLVNLLPINQMAKNELLIGNPSLTQNLTQGPGIQVTGSVNDCKITCTLLPKTTPLNQNQQIRLGNRYQYSRPLVEVQPIQAQPLVSYASRQTAQSGRSSPALRSTPPYAAMDYRVTARPIQPQIRVPKMVPVKAPALPQPDARKIIHNLAIRRPVAIMYEKAGPRSVQLKVQTPPSIVTDHLELLRRQIVALNLIRLSKTSNLVAGFVETPSNDVRDLSLARQANPHSGHEVDSRFMTVLDQLDFQFPPTIYHLSVGLTNDLLGRNVTAVYFSVGGKDVRQLSVLPVRSPRAAMFFPMMDKMDKMNLMLLVSQDDHYSEGARGICPRYSKSPSLWDRYVDSDDGTFIQGGVHVYLFHANFNSSSFESAYFDLDQTIDVPAIDGFANFYYEHSHYALAYSRSTSRIHIFLNRGYSGFQLVSQLRVPMIENVDVLYTADQRPILMIHQTDGLHKLMEPVII